MQTLDIHIRALKST